MSSKYKKSFNRRMTSYDQWCKRVNGKRALAEADCVFDPLLERLKQTKIMLNREARRHWNNGRVRDLPDNPAVFRMARPGEFFDPLEEDHIWPISQGGRWGIENTRLLRRSKNCLEQSRSEEEINRLLRIHKVVIHKFIATGQYDYYE